MASRKRSKRPKAKRSKKAARPGTRAILVPQEHGGALQVGNPGNRGGGRPPSELRARLRGSFAERIPVIEDIADGEVMQRKEFPVISLLRHVHCPKCGATDLHMNCTDAIEAMSITLVGKVSATPKDRIAAIDLAAKYGLGTKDEISVVSPDVLARLEQQAARFVSELTPSALEVVRRIVDEIWQ